MIFHGGVIPVKIKNESIGRSSGFKIHRIR